MVSRKWEVIGLYRAPYRSESQTGCLWGPCFRGIKTAESKCSGREEKQRVWCGGLKDPRLGPGETGPVKGENWEDIDTMFSI